MDHSAEACVGFIAAHGDALELLEFAEEILDQMPPFVNLFVDDEWRLALRPLRDDDFGAAFIQVFDDPVRIERLVGDEPSKLDVFDEWRNADGVIALSRQQNEAHQIAQSIGHREDFGRPAAFRLADGLILSPPFAPWP